MARFLAKVPSPHPIARTFDYLADFSTTRLWDPSVTQAERTSAGPVGEGSTFEVTVSFFGSTSTIPYRIVEYEAPYRVALLGESSTVRSYDEITFVPVGSGCQVVYDAELSLIAPWFLAPAASVAEMWVNVLFQWSGNRSAAGLERALCALPA